MSDSMKPLIFGEVLFDHFPDGSRVLGGAPFNVAWNLQAFGTEPLLISRVGNDPLGRQIRKQMECWGMNTSALQLDSAHPTGTVEVTIAEGEPSFDIINERAYDYIDYDALPPLPKNALLYHGTLALRNRVSADTLLHLTGQYQSPRFIDINLREPWWNREGVLEQLFSASWAKLNHAELQALSEGDSPLLVQAEQLQKSMKLELLVITHGAKGALARTSDGELFDIAPAGVASVIDTVGAGDAFSSIMILGLLLGWEIPLMLKRAQAFASAVVGLRGATTDNKNFYTPFREQWGL